MRYTFTAAARPFNVDADPVHLSGEFECPSEYSWAEAEDEAMELAIVGAEECGIEDPEISSLSVEEVEE